MILKKKTHLFKKNIKEGRDLSSILPETFALVREAAKRVLKERHYDVQLVGGIALQWKNRRNENRRR